MELSRRGLIIGGLSSLIVAPAIVRPESIMRIFSVDDWNPWRLAFQGGGGSWMESMFNDPVFHRIHGLKGIIGFHQAIQNGAVFPGMAMGSPYEIKRQSECY